MLSLITNLTRVRQPGFNIRVNNPSIAWLWLESNNWSAHCLTQSDKLEARGAGECAEQASLKFMNKSHHVTYGYGSILLRPAGTLLENYTHIEAHTHTHARLILKAGPGSVWYDTHEFCRLLWFQQIYNVSVWQSYSDKRYFEQITHVWMKRLWLLLSRPKIKPATSQSALLYGFIILTILHISKYLTAFYLLILVMKANIIHITPSLQFIIFS